MAEPPADSSLSNVTDSLSKMEVLSTALPTWVQDIVDAQGELDLEPEGTESEDSESGQSESRQSESGQSVSGDPGPSKLSPEDFDSLQKVIANPSEAITTLRDLYANRVRLGTNKELWEAIELLSKFLAAPAAYIDEATASLVFPKMFDAGLFELFEHIISDGDLFEDSTEWTDNVLHCLEYLTAIAASGQHWDGLRWRDHDIRQLFANPKWNILWVPPDRHSFRTRLAELMSQMFQDAWAHQHRFKTFERSFADFFSPYHYTPSFVQNKTVRYSFRRLCLLLWMTIDDDVDGADTLFAIMMSSFHYESEDAYEEGYLTRFVAEDMTDTYGAVPILERLCQSLNRPGTLGASFHAELFVGATDVLLCSDYWPYLSEKKVFPALQYAMNYHLQEYPHDDVEFFLIQHLVRLEELITESTTFQSGAGMLIREADIVTTLARLVSLSLDSTKVPDLELCTDVMGEWIKVATALSLRSGKNEMRKKFKRSLRREWYPTLRHLRTAARSEEVRRKKVVKMWIGLGSAMDLDENKEKAEYEHEMKRVAQFCAWKDCQFHTVKPEMPTRVCAGCDEVRYCGKPCQKRDWKEGGHKLRCRRIKAG